MYHPLSRLEWPTRKLVMAAFWADRQHFGGIESQMIVAFFTDKIA